MSPLPQATQHYAGALPELVTPWRAADFSDPQVLLLNEPLAHDLGLDGEWLLSNPAELLGGSWAPDPVAMAYAGHQFGVYVPRLGDGRALLLGELSLRDGSGERLVDLHLKGSGPTPFSRGGDGYGALGPMLREHVVSEAMHRLGVPTSRSLAVLNTGDVVRREVPLPGAVLVRVAASHIRVGTFQLARSNEEVLRRLADYSISRHYPDLQGDYAGFYSAVIAAQARLVARWMGSGFIHGVMNTDNTTISGETIDYGPCAFLDVYDPAAVFSSIDHRGRYAYGNQPAIMQWNLARLGEALLPLIGEQSAQNALDGFAAEYQGAHLEAFSRKLGVHPGPDARGLITEFLDLLAREGLDFTNSFRALTAGNSPSGSTEMTAWMARWEAQGPDTSAMEQVNPLYIPRNFPLQLALNRAEDGDLTSLEALMGALDDPFTVHPGAEEFLEPGPAGFQTFCGT